VDRDRPDSPGPDDSSSAAHELEGDERMYTGEPVETETGLRRPQQMNVGIDNMEGGGEWPDPDAPASPGATGWDRRRMSAPAAGASRGARDSHITADHDEIRTWVEDHGGRPVRARAPDAPADRGLPQIDFLHGRGDRSLEPVEWDEWFRMFDDYGLAVLFRDGDEERWDRASLEFVRR
jgi:hypothetical protein